MPVKKRLVKKRLRCQQGTAVFLAAFAAGGLHGDGFYFHLEP